MAGCPQGNVVMSLFGLWQLQRNFIWEDNWYFQLWLHLQQQGPRISVQSLHCPTQLSARRRGFCAINSNNINLQIIYTHPTPTKKSPQNQKNPAVAVCHCISFKGQDNDLEQTAETERLPPLVFYCSQHFQRVKEFLDDQFENLEN